MDNLDKKLSAVLTQYFEVEENQLQSIVSEVKKEVNPSSVKASKDKILKSLELHGQASQFVEEEVIKFREDLYLFAKKIAARELEENIITKSHVIKAREFLWRKENKYDWSDIFLGVGGLLLGSSIPHFIELVNSQKEVEPIGLLLMFGIIGAISFGMGIITKLKK